MSLPAMFWGIKLYASSKGGRVEGENEMAISGLGYRKHLLRTGQGVFYMDLESSLLTL